MLRVADAACGTSKVAGWWGRSVIREYQRSRDAALRATPAYLWVCAVQCQLPTRARAHTVGLGLKRAVAWVCAEGVGVVGPLVNTTGSGPCARPSLGDPCMVLRCCVVGCNA